jgi:hypothetical protein
MLARPRMTKPPDQTGAEKPKDQTRPKEERFLLRVDGQTKRIGSGNRLDFTCIGPAVNPVARLEKLAGRLGRTILASEDFVHQCGDDGLQPIGRFAVAGFANEQMVYGLDFPSHVGTNGPGEVC